MNPGRILVASDEPQSMRALRSMLVARQYEVYDARIGEPTLECMRRNQVDLIILDFAQPDARGPEACRSIRMHSEAGLLMLAKWRCEKEKIAALEAGADDCLTKPFDTGELLARIRVIMRRLPLCGAQMPKLVQLDGMQIDLDTRHVVSPTQRVRLTPKEFNLLQYFIVNSNAAVPHAKLLQAVWGPDYRDHVEYLRVFINQLRRKIEPDPAHPRYLLTEPWIGYRFVMPSQQSQVWR